jgi:hypothetical protein
MGFLSHYMAQTSEELRATRALLVFVGTTDRDQKGYDKETLLFIHAILTDRGPDDGETTFDELIAVAKERGGLDKFDSALPQMWCDNVKEKTGTYPRGFVWSYPKMSIWGEAFPLTSDARELLAKYEEATK